MLFVVFVSVLMPEMSAVIVLPAESARLSVPLLKLSVLFVVFVSVLMPEMPAVIVLPAESVRLSVRQTVRQSDRQTDRQTDKQTDLFQLMHESVLYC